MHAVTSCSLVTVPRGPFLALWPQEDRAGGKAKIKVAKPSWRSWKEALYPPWYTVVCSSYSSFQLWAPVSAKSRLKLLHAHGQRCQAVGKSPSGLDLLVLAPQGLLQIGDALLQRLQTTPPSRPHVLPRAPHLLSRRSMSHGSVGRHGPALPMQAAVLRNHRFTMSRLLIP